MTKTDVIRMAEECELFDGIWSHPELKELKADKFIKFANLAAAIERDACAKVCEDLLADEFITRAEATVWDVATLDCATAIRARGQK